MVKRKGGGKGIMSIIYFISGLWVGAIVGIFTLIFIQNATQDRDD